MEELDAQLLCKRLKIELNKKPKSRLLTKIDRRHLSTKVEEYPVGNWRIIIEGS